MKKLFRATWWFLKRLTLFFFISSLFIVLLYRFVFPPLTPTMIARFFEQLFGKYDVRFKRDYTKLDAISPFMQKAVIASEDQKFINHYGFDFEAIRKAFENNRNKNRKILKGGSTISQQVAKNVFLWQGRSYLRKVLEAYFTVLIEIFWTKKRILEMYLNVIEMGNGIYGVEAASECYFNKTARKLNAPESALIAAILPNPRNWSPVKPTNYIQGRKTWILSNMAKISLRDL